MLSPWTTFTTVKSHLTWFRAMQLTKICKPLKPIEIEELEPDLRTFAAYNNWKFSFRDSFWIFQNPSKTSRLICLSQHLISDWFKLKHVSILETIEAFYVVHVAPLSNFVGNIINKKSYEPARAYGSCNFAHKSRNALALIRFPILTLQKAIYLIRKAPCSPCGTFLFTTKPIFILNACADY